MLEDMCGRLRVRKKNLWVMTSKFGADMCSASCAAKHRRQPVWITRARSTSGLRAASTYPQSGSPSPVQTLRPCDPETFIAARVLIRLAACRTLRALELPRRREPSCSLALRSRSIGGSQWKSTDDNQTDPRKRTAPVDARDRLILALFAQLKAERETREAIEDAIRDGVLSKEVLIAIASDPIPVVTDRDVAEIETLLDRDSSDEPRLGGKPAERGNE